MGNYEITVTSRRGEQISKELFSNKRVSWKRFKELSAIHEDSSNTVCHRDLDFVPTSKVLSK